jgi:hypothetical protein
MPPAPALARSTVSATTPLVIGADVSNDVHVYASGRDPFVIQVGGVRYFIHAGSPGDEKSEANPAPETGKDDEILVPTRPRSYRDLVVQDLDDERLRSMLGTVESGTGVRVHLRPDPTERMQLDGLLDGLREAQATDVQVHLIPDQADD